MQRKSAFVFSFCLLAALLALAADPAPGVLSVDDIKKVVPRRAHFFRGQSAPVQIRKFGGISVPLTAKWYWRAWSTPPAIRPM